MDKFYDEACINNIKVDSRVVNNGDYFFAIKGEILDGHHYIDKAINNGASRVVSQYNVDDKSIENNVVSDTKDELAELLFEKYGYIFDKLKVIGLTGTNGKTTTGYLLYEALNELNEKCGYIGTLGVISRDINEKMNNTTPGILDIYKYLLFFYEKHYDYVVMEISSHSLIQKRVLNIPLSVGIYTNLSHEHLDYHKTMDEYAEAKSIMFKNLSTEAYAIINKDDMYHKYMVNTDATIKYYSKEETDNIRYKDLKLHFVYKRNKIKTNLYGDYNVYNVLAIIKTLEVLDFKLSKIVKVLSVINLPSGRLEKVKGIDKNVFIDFAHSPDAVENVLKSVRKFTERKICCVIGSGGNRDKTKRKEMGKIASDLSDIAIFTTDNPRYEEPLEIIWDMMENITKNNVIIIPDRKKAIEYGLYYVTDKDILLILGKGHEEYQEIKGKRVFFSDHKTVTDLMK